MKNPLKRKTKGMAKENKFSGRRLYAVRTGAPEKLLSRLNDLYELLQCDPDEHGYVVTTFKEMNELTEMDVNFLTIMIQNGLILKRNTGGSPKFKYKWDTIKPTLPMALKLFDKKLNMKAGKNTPDNTIVSESKPESLLPELEKTVIVDKPEYIPGRRTPIPEIHASHNNFDSSIILDSSVEDGIMTAHVNLEKLGITESAVLNAILAIEK